MDAEPLAIRRLGVADVAAAAALSRAEGWPHAEADWARSLGLSSGFGVDDAAGLAATALLTRFGDHTATANMVIVRRDLRGRGLGRRLVEALLAEAGPREVRLVATADGLPLYRRIGFETVGEIRQHTGAVAGATAAGGGVVWATPADLPALARLDAAAFGADRAGLVAALAGASRIAVARGDAGPVGFAMRRPLGRGEVVGPVVAPDLATAERLIATHLAQAAGRLVRVDTRADTGLVPFLERHGLAHAGGGTAMTLNRRADGPRAVTTYALASQAFG